MEAIQDAFPALSQATKILPFLPLIRLEYAFGDGHRGHCLRPARVECQLGDRLDELLLGHAVIARERNMEVELLGIAHGNQGGHRDEASVPL